MFDLELENLLIKKLEETPLEVREQFKKNLLKIGLKERNSSFVEFWSRFGDEVYGKYGHLLDFNYEVEDFADSYTSQLREEEGLNKKYLSILSSELDDYIFYDIKTDTVLFVSAENFDDFLEDGTYDKKWDSFNSFLTEFLSE